MYDTRAVRKALKALGSEPAPVPVDDERRVVLAGGGNEVAMSLYQAMGRGTRALSEAQIHQRQEEMLAQFEREAQQVLRMLGAFRTVISLEDERAARRGLPASEEVTVVATGTGTLHHAAVAPGTPVQPGATYRLVPRLEAAPEGTLGTEEGAVGRWEGTSASQAAVDRRVQRIRRERVAPDMETCDQCRKTVMFDPHDGSFTHEDGSPAWSKDGHIIHEDRLQAIIQDERLREMELFPLRWTEVEEPLATVPDPNHPAVPDMPVQEGPAMSTEEEATRIVRRAMEVARADIDAYRARSAHHDRDSGIEPGYIDSTDSSVLDALPDPAEHGLGRRLRDRLERWRRYLDGYTAREMDELERHQRRR
jgi:hypothetical protein